jgi:hypothetical protein
MSNAIAKLPTTTLAKMSEQEWELLIGVLAGFQSLAGKKFNAEDKMQRYTLDIEVSILQEYYPELTLANIQEALKLAHVGKLKNFGVTGKSVIENIPELLNAYNQYLLDGKNMIQAVEEEPKEIVEQKNAKLVQETIAEFEQMVAKCMVINTEGMQYSDIYALKLKWDILLNAGVVQDEGFEDLEKEIYGRWYQKIINPFFYKCTQQIRQAVISEWEKGKIHGELEYAASSDIKAEKLRQSIIKRSKSNK